MADPISWIAAKAAEWVAMTAFQLASATGVSVTTAATVVTQWRRESAISGVTRQ